MTFTPLTIGQLRLRNNLIAAPMAGLSSLPYRMLAMECGCGLAISEMVSAEGAIRAQEKTARYFANDASVRPFGLQLFGANPDAIAEAIERLAGEPIDLIDINMGCPVKKVVQKGAGAALMKAPERVANIVSAARKATRLPLTIKIRAGWDERSINCTEIARIAEAEGADAVALHARTRAQGYKGQADWNLIAKMRQAVDIPVIGNGDVRSHEDAIRMFEVSGCHGIMIGRGALGNPWIFREILEGRTEVASLSEKGATALRHFELLSVFLGEKLAILNMRTMLSWYGRGTPGVKRFMQRVHGTTTGEKLRQEIAIFFGVSSHQCT